MKKLKAYLSLTRPPNGILMFIGILAGIALSHSKTVDLIDLTYSFITAYSLNGSSMILNDYFDREVDKINAPHRPLPSGLITPSQALVYSSILGIVGTLSSLLISLYCMFIAIASYAAAIFYNMSLKKSGLLGNFTVSLVVTAPFIFGSTMSDGYITDRIIVFIIPVLLSNTGREVIKGISDIEGDAIREVRSIARIMGARSAGLIGSTLYVLAIAFSPAPYFLGYVSDIYLPIVLVADAGFAYSAYSILKWPSRENAARVKNQTLIWMLIALIAYILGGVL